MTKHPCWAALPVAGALAGAIILITSIQVAADEIRAPTDPIAKAAFDFLDKHCAECHQIGRLRAREKPSKNFGNVLMLDELAANRRYIIPGDPLNSYLFKQVFDKECPYGGLADLPNDKPPPTSAELGMLERWIESLRK
jgi:hypothetical protein